MGFKYRCKQCLTDLDFEIPMQTVTTTYPIILDKIHGNPAHKLIIYINKAMQVETFQIIEGSSELKPSSNITQEVLTAIELTEPEIQLYMHCSGKGPVSKGEMAILQGIPIESVDVMITHFVSKGLFKEIMGSKNYFQALPPYAAIIDQLQRFTHFIQEIKYQTPIDLQNSFESFEEKAQGVQNLKAFVGYLKSLRKSTADKLAEQSKTLEATLQLLVDQQKNVDKIASLRDSSITIMTTQLDLLTHQLDGVKGKISENLEKLRLGIILKTVEDIIGKVITTELEQIKRNFQVQFASQIQGYLDQIVQQIINTGTNAGNMATDLRQVFSSISSQFDTTLADSQNRITNIADSLLKSFEELRNIFSEKVLITLDDVLEKIVRRIQNNTITIQEFWDQAKSVINFTMKDVWFIQSAEGMEAQINDAVSRAKMRILIVAPTLLDVEIAHLIQLPNHINIRICCAVDPAKPIYATNLKLIENHSNIVVRNRELQNLWGINRDYEEIIVGIVSKPTVATIANTPDFAPALEVAGIGSILSEHIKIFVPILEDAWMGSKKEFHVMENMESNEREEFQGNKNISFNQHAEANKMGSVIAIPIQSKPMEAAISSKPEENIASRVRTKVSTLLQPSIESTTKIEVPASKTIQTPISTSTSTSVSKLTPAPTSNSVPTPTSLSSPIPIPTQSPVKTPASTSFSISKNKPTTPTPTESTLYAGTPAKMTQNVMYSKTSSPVIATSDQFTPQRSKFGSLKIEFEELQSSIKTIDPRKLVSEIEHLRERIKTDQGFSPVLTDMKNWEDLILRDPAFDEAKRNQIIKRVQIWKEKTVK